MRRHASLTLLSGLLDGELDERQRSRVTAHLEDCDACRHRLDGLRRVVSRLRQVEPLPPPAELGYWVGREVADLPRRASLSERLERRARALIIQPVLVPTVSVVLALAVIFYLLSYGVARKQEAPTRIVIEPGREAAAPAATEVEGEPEGLRVRRLESIAAAGAPSGGRRVVEGRLFERVGDVWVEQGAAGSEPVERIDLRLEGSGKSAAGLEPFAVLGGRVRLKLDARVVEVVYPPASDSP